MTETADRDALHRWEGEGGKPALELDADAEDLDADADAEDLDDPMPELTHSMRAIGAYTLDDDGKPQECDNLMAWARFMEDKERRQVAAEWPVPGILVSTVFLGLDQSALALPTPDGFRTFNRAPVLWETMIFGGKYDMYQERYASIEAALEGHRAAVQLVLASLPN
jgi:hypothetical protein